MSRSGRRPEIQDADLVKPFLVGARKKRKILMDALLRCATAEDQIPAETLRSAIDAISNTIAAIRAGTKLIPDLKRYRVSVTLPTTADDDEIDLTVEITQRAQSHPLPPLHYIEVTVPLADPAVSPTTRARATENYTYIHTFNLGERTVRQVEFLKSKDIQFRIFKRRTAIVGEEKARPLFIGLATAPLAQLAFALNATAPLNFLGMDGRRTPFLFDVRISVPTLLVCHSDMAIDEMIDVLME
jgi:hypothetical protein